MLRVAGGASAALATAEPDRMACAHAVAVHIHSLLLEARMQLLRACGRLSRNTAHGCAHTTEAALRTASKHAETAFRRIRLLETLSADCPVLHDFLGEHRQIVASIVYLKSTTLFVTQAKVRSGSFRKHHVSLPGLVGDFADLPPVVGFGELPCDLYA